MHVALQSPWTRKYEKGAPALQLMILVLYQDTERHIYWGWITKKKLLERFLFIYLNVIHLCSCVESYIIEQFCNEESG